MSRTFAFYHALAPNWRGVIFGAFIGAAIGGLLYKTVLGETFAISIVQLGQVDRRNAPDLLISKMQTPEFAQRIASIIGDPGVISRLPARQYGGTGRLKVRPIGDGALIEIRSNLGDQTKALAVVDAAANLALTDDNNMLSELRKSYADHLADLNQQLTDTKATLEYLNKALHGSIWKDATVTAMVQSQAKVYSLSQDIWSTETALAPPFSRDSTIFSTATLARPLLNSLWFALIIGSLGGAAVAYAVSLSQKYGKNNQIAQN